jgi:putative ABC transport system substrate-binding protein
LARPGGQVTGISNLSDDLVPKQMEFLKAAVPRARLIGMTMCPRCLARSGVPEAHVAAERRRREDAASSLGTQLVVYEVNSADDFSAASAAIEQDRPDCLLLTTNEINFALKPRWLALSAQQKLPMMAFYRGYGAALSYGVDPAAMYRRAAEFAARILTGASPGDIPMEQPNKLEFVINVKVAKEIGLTIPQAVLVRADELIE